MARLNWCKTLILLSVISASAHTYSQAAEKKISYLPRNEDMLTASKNYTDTSVSPAGPLTLSSFECASAKALFDKVTLCLDCVQRLKPSCPDQCLYISTTRALRCTPDDLSENYNCSSAAFNDPSTLPDYDTSSMPPDPGPPYETTDCPAPKNFHNYQVNGCPRIKPTDSSCVEDGGGNWHCAVSDPDMQPEKPGFSPLSSSSLEKPAFSSYYTIDTVDPCTVIPGAATCYRYNPLSDFTDYITRCRQYTLDFEQCTQRVYCCRETEFVPDPIANPSVKMKLSSCPRAECEERINWPECDSYTSSQCCRFQQEAVECLSGGGCSDCFKEIDSGLKLQFVAKSGESFIISWQLITRLATPLAQTAYLFTKIKVVEKRYPYNVVFDSSIHQKNLEAAFSIYRCTHIDKDVLTPGSPYVVKLYYFLPSSVLPNGSTSSINVNLDHAQLTLIRYRE